MGVYVVVILNSNVILKKWIACKIRIDCSVLHCGSQCKFHPQDIMMQDVTPGGEHPDTLKLSVKAFDIKLFVTQRTIH
jgi:hypothetical protein